MLGWIQQVSAFILELLKTSVNDPGDEMESVLIKSAGHNKLQEFKNETRIQNCAETRKMWLEKIR